MQQFAVVTFQDVINRVKRQVFEYYPCLLSGDICFLGTNLLQVTTHELGHSLGLSHSNDPNSVMAPFYRGYSPSFNLGEDDIDAIRFLYGKRWRFRIQDELLKLQEKLLMSILPIFWNRAPKCFGHRDSVQNPFLGICKGTPTAMIKPLYLSDFPRASTY